MSDLQETSNNKKCLHVRLTSDPYLNGGITEAFELNGYEVSEFDWQKVKINCGVKGMRDRMIGKASMEMPDIIFIQIQNEGILDVDTCISLSSFGFTILYTVDVRDNIDWIEKLSPHLGLVCFCDQYSKSKLEEKGFTNVGYLQASCDQSVYTKFRTESKNKYPDIVFIGNNYSATNINFPQAKQRQEMINFMFDNYGDRFMSYGIGQKGGYMNPQKEIECYNSAKISITQNNFNRIGYTSDRLFRSMSCGIATISQYYADINKDFNYTHLSTWLDFDMLKKECDTLLENEELRLKKAQSGLEHVVLNHSWNTRVKQLEKMIPKTVFNGERI